MPITHHDAKMIATNMVAINPWRTLGYSVVQLENYLISTDPALYRFTVRVDQDIAGVVAIRHPWLKGPYLELIAIFPHKQQRGLGTTILQWLEQQAKPTNKNVWVLVSSFNKVAKKFYLQQGFKEIAPIESLVSTQSTELLLRKIIH
jgi:N-acetylglutamate synthase-like GNAT family acetyltransferase